MSLERAIRELAAGDSAFYETVREAWRGCRCAELADVLEELSRKHGRPPLDGAKQKAWHTTWIARVREESPLDLAGLTKALVDRATTRQASMVASCLDELTRHADDPVLVKPMMRLLEIEPASSAWNKVHTRIFALLEAAGDPRAIEMLLAPLHTVKHTAQKWSDSMRDSLARAERVRDKLRARFPDGVPTAPPGTTEACAKLLATNPAKPLVWVQRVDELDTLYAAVLEDPDDDARRAVYADALQQRGDPRGEIIALQLAGSPKANAMIAKHRRHLLGGIAKVVLADSAVFEKGFLVACETDVRRATQAKVVFGRDEWATVKRIVFREHAALTRAMRSLEEAIGVADSALSALREITLPKLRVLEIPHVWLERGPKGGLAVLAETTGLPSLRELHIRTMYGNTTPEDFDWLWGAPCGAKLERLVLPLVRSDIETWRMVVKSHPTLRQVAHPNNSIVVEK